MRIKLYIVSLFLLSGMLFAENTLSLEDNGDGTWNVNYSSDDDINGFQFNVDGASILSAGGGDAESAGFMISASDATVLGFTLSGTSIPLGEGLLVVLDLSGTPTGLSGIIVSDSGGSALDFPSCFIYGGSSGELDECGVCAGDGIADGACDCAGNVEDCAGDCGGSGELDECGVCAGDGIVDGACDCAGNVEDCAGDCGGSAVVDECGVCDGDGTPCATLSFGAATESSVEIWLDNLLEVAGFQFNIRGLDITGASGGSAEAAGFMISSSATTVVGFSLTGATIPPGEGVLVNISLTGSGEACLSDVVLSDAIGNSIDTEIGECVNTEDVCESGIYDCAGECDGDAGLDECGICNGDGSSCEVYIESEVETAVDETMLGNPDFEDNFESFIESALDLPEQTVEVIDVTVLPDSREYVQVLIEFTITLTQEELENTNFESGNAIEMALVDVENDIEDGGIEFIDGCADPDACNYDPDATVNDGSCLEANIMCWDGSYECDISDCPNEPDECVDDPTVCIFQAWQYDYDNQQECEDSDGVWGSYLEYYGTSCDLLLNDVNVGCESSILYWMVSDICPVSCNTCTCYEYGACNFENQGPCDFPEENYDCDGNCTVEDCAGDCGGDAVLSGCDNTCNSTAVVDCAGVCDGDSVLSGCDNTCNSTAVVDCAGVCDGDSVLSGCDNTCNSTTVVDCAGVCDGDSVLSGCDNTCNSTAVVDCAGVCDGDSVLSGCDNTCNSTAVVDCAGVCDGDSVLSGCDNTCNSTAVVDCAGVCDGDSVLSGCDNTCNSTAVVDCAGVCGGSSIDDECGVCMGNGCFEQDCETWPAESFDCDGYNLGDLEFLQAFVDSSNLVIDPLTFGTQTWSNNGRLNILIIQNMFNGTDIGDSLLMPEIIGNMDSLISLVIQNNSSLIGSIPEGIGNLTQLTVLTLEENSLTGEIPDTLSNLVNLTKLKLKDNQFIGAIPESLCNLDSTMNWSSLTYFTIKDNYLCPPYPDCMADYIDYGDQCGRFATDDEDDDVPVACDFCELKGCTDSDACNYFSLCSNSDYVCENDGSCKYPKNCLSIGDTCEYIGDYGGNTSTVPNTNWDCDGDCIVGFDCNNECGGSAIIDECGNCNGTCIMTNTNYFGIDVTDYIVCSENQNNDIIAGCDGVCGSPYMADACGNCSGDCSYIDPVTEEPYENNLMVCSENAGIVKNYNNPFYLDFRSLCQEYYTLQHCDDLFEAAISSDMIKLPDCAGECGGEAIIDDCGVCAGDNGCLSLRELFIPADYSIYNIYPNPFNPVTNIMYGLPENVYVKILIFDIHGNLVQTLINNYQTAGYHSLEWNAVHHSSGLYFVKIIAGSSIGSETNFSKTQKLMLVK